MEESDSFWERTFTYGLNTLLISYENGHVTDLTITDSQWPVKIEGRTVKVVIRCQASNRHLGVI